MKTGIPKKLGHIWIGPKPMPSHWMETWPEKHPEWQYRIYDNDFLHSFPFRTRRLINEYFWRGEYAGVQDLMRYEILYKYGGFMADADAICRHPIDELVNKKCAYTVYDRAIEEGRGVSPFLACDPGNALVGEVINRLEQLEPWELRKPFHSTGNLFLMRTIQELGEDNLTIWPSHYFIPWHHSTPDDVYTGPDKIYAEQQWGTATYRYNSLDIAGEKHMTRQEVAVEAAKLRRSMAAVVQPDLDMSKDETQPDDPAVRAADVEMAAYDQAIKSAEWTDKLASLNATICDTLSNAGQTPEINGTPFYRFRQGHLITESALMGRTNNLRQRVAAWMRTANTVMHIGVDAGHMVLLNKVLNPKARIVAVDTGTNILQKSAALDVYQPASINWLTAEYGDDIRFLIGRPSRVIMNFRKGNRRVRPDLLQINGIDANFLKSYSTAAGSLRPESIILIHDMNADKLRLHIEELQMICEVAEPIEFTDFGTGRGAMAVFRRLPDSARQ